MATQNLQSKIPAEAPSTPENKAPFDLNSPSFITNSNAKFFQLDALRANREDERIELQNLNQRLEMYIMRQRARDAGEGDLRSEFENLLQKYEKDIKKLKELCDGQVAHVRKVYEQQVQQYNSLKLENDTLNANHTNLTRDHVSLQDYASQLKTHNEALAVELSETKAALLAARNEARNALRDLETERIRHTQLRNDYSEAVKNLDDANAAVVRHEATIHSLREKVVVTEKATKTELDLLRRQLKDAVERSDANMDAVRADYESRMQRIFEEQDLASRKDRDQALSAINDEYQDKVLGYRASLEKMGHDLEVERNKVNAALNDLNTVMQENEDLKSIINTMQTKINDLNIVVERMRDGESDIIREKNEVIRKIKEAFKAKDQEFDALMDAKIALTLELQAYETLLQTEEARLGIVGSAFEGNSPVLQPVKPEQRGLLDRLFGGNNNNNANNTDSIGEPSRKRLRSTSLAMAAANGVIASPLTKPKPKLPKSTTTTTSSTTTTDAFVTSSSLLISGQDTFSHYVAVRNGSEHPVDLTGWKLVTEKLGYEFEFPKGATLEPDAVFTLRTGEEIPGDFPHTAWASHGCWDASGDFCKLVDPNNQIKAKVEIAPSSDVSQNNTNDCIVM